VVKAVVYGRDAARTLSRLPRNVEHLIRSKLDLYAADPAALANNVKTLQGSSPRGPARLRLRVGNWRVVFTAEAEQIIVEAVGSRGSIYD
jgi:mRNA interferase RelE/StbE